MSLTRYRKKPVVIQAARFDPNDPDALRELLSWCGGAFHQQSKASDHTDVGMWIDIPTLEGVMCASVGDYVIRGVQGEFYPCKPDIFAATYEAVE